MGSITTFNGLLKLFSKAGAAAPSTLSLGSISGEVVPCLNTTDEELETGDQVFVGQTVDGRWAVIPTGTSTGSGTGTPRIQFVTTGKMTDRGVTVKVLRAHNNAPDIDDTGMLVPGDTLTVYDPFNLWSDVEAKATGWAYLAQAQVDDETTGDINEEHVIRYEIEECTHPINRIEGYLRSALYSNNAAEVVVDISDPNFVSRDLIRSTYPNVDVPEADIDASDTGSPYFTSYEKIDCQNPYYLDGIPGSKVVIERVTNKLASDPENYEAPLARSGDTWQWEVVSVEKRFARHIEVESGSGGSWTKVAHFSGHWPPNQPSVDGLINEYEPTISCDHCFCIDAGEPGYAFFDSNTGNYKVVSTKSAFYGEASDVSVATGAYLTGCTLSVVTASVKVLCPPTGGGVTQSSISTTTQTVTTGASIGIEEGCGSPCTWQYRPVEGSNPNCAGAQCQWRWDAFIQDWERVPEDPDCPAGCSCVAPPHPDDAATKTHGDIDFTNCTGGEVEYDWVRILECETELCDCSKPFTPGGAEPWAIMETPCSGAGGDSSRLCLYTETASFTTIDCTGGSGPSSTPGLPGRSCIELDDQCPDACANPVS